MVDGFHVPVIPLSDVVGNAGAVAFWHNGAICVNVGIACALMVTVSDVAIAHCPVFGVNE